MLSRDFFQPTPFQYADMKGAVTGLYEFLADAEHAFLQYAHCTVVPRGKELFLDGISAALFAYKLENKNHESAEDSQPWEREPWNLIQDMKRPLRKIINREFVSREEARYARYIASALAELDEKTVDLLRLYR